MGLGIYMIKRQLGLMVMVCTFYYDVVGNSYSRKDLEGKKEKSCGIDVVAYREESGED